MYSIDDIKKADHIIKRIVYSFFAIMFIGCVFSCVNRDSQNVVAKEQQQENTILNRDVVAIDMAGDYFIELSDPSKVGDFINEGNRTKGIYLILSKSRQKQGEIYNEIITNCKILQMDVDCKRLSMLDPVNHSENSETVYVMSIEFVRVR